MYSNDRLFIMDADGTTIDAFSAIERTFLEHNMDIGDLERFQKRRNLFKYLGGLKEFPTNLKQQISKQKRSKLIATLTEVYREEARLYVGIDLLVQRLIAAPGLRVGLITRNITDEPKETLRILFRRHRIDVDALDFLVHIPLKQSKVEPFRRIRNELRINPARAYACGDEKKDFLAAVATGMHPFMVSYGFDDYERLTGKAGVPTDVISRDPEEFRERVFHALDLGPNSVIPIAGFRPRRVTESIPVFQ